MDSLPPLLNPCSRWGGSAAPPFSASLSFPMARCLSRPPGWGAASWSLLASGSRSPWAAGGGTPGTVAAALNTPPARLPASGLLSPASPGCNGPPGWPEPEVIDTAMAPGPPSGSAAGSRGPSIPILVAGGRRLLVSCSPGWPRPLIPRKAHIRGHKARWSSSPDSNFYRASTLGVVAAHSSICGFLPMICPSQMCPRTRVSISIPSSRHLKPLQ